MDYSTSQCDKGDKGERFCSRMTVDYVSSSSSIIS